MYKSNNKLANFMNGFTAAVELSQRAGESGFFIEFICLTASIIDGFLRIGLILRHQLEAKTSEILDCLLYQDKKDKIVTERKIYRMSLEKSIISQELFDKLNELYHKRNKVVHRYIISDISTKEALDIGIEYEKIKFIVGDSIRNLENEQIEKGVGMVVLDNGTPDADLKRILDKMSAEKHGDDKLNKELKNRKNL